MNDKKISPLEVLVAAHNVHPVKIVPKNRFEEQIIPIVESAPINTGENQPIIISNSSLTVNFHMNIDSEVVKKAMKKSAEVAKNIAAMGAAFLGTAMIFGGTSKKMSKVKIPLTPRTKLPRI